MTNTVQLNSKVLSINNSNDIYMTLDMGVCSSDFNLNKVRFTEKFINNYKETLVDMPVVVDREALESDEKKILTHKFDGENLNTDSIGVITEVWTEEDEEDVIMLYARAKIWKRYPKTCQAILELFSSENLRFSTEVLVEEAEINDDGTTEIIKGSFLANCIVTYPAEVRATARKLVAEAMSTDLFGGEIVGKQTKVAELSFDQIREKIWDQLNPIVNDTREYNYWIFELFQTYVIAISEDDGKLYKFNYSITENEVNVNLESKVEVVIQYVPVENVNDIEPSEIHKEVKELRQQQQQLNDLKEEKEKLEKQLSETENSKEEKINELNDKIVGLNETINELQNKVEILTESKKELEEIKKQQKEKELAEKRENLKKIALKSGYFTEEDIITELAEIIEKCDEKELKARIAEKVLAEKQDNDDNNDDIVIETSSDGRNLMPEDKTYFTIEN